jgi:mono/diheme cytochrome c family protein
MLRKSLLSLSVLAATAACGQSQSTAPAAPAAAPAPVIATPSAPAVVVAQAPTTPPAAPPAPAAAASGKLYTVVDGYKVDPETMKGFRTWRAAACDRCHGANQEGLVGPSLVNSLKTLTKEEFLVTVRDGRLLKGMQSFGTSEQVMGNINQLYAYLKGRSDGAITRSKVEPIQ